VLPADALLDEQGECRAGTSGALGMLDELLGDRAPVDDRVAPLVERDHLGQQLGTHPVGLAGDRVDLQVAAHTPALAIAASARGW
jgi:hypothetical protein